MKCIMIRCIIQTTALPKWWRLGVLIFSTLLADFKEPKQNQHMVPAPWAELDIAHLMPSLFFYFPIPLLLFC